LYTKPDCLYGYLLIPGYIYTGTDQLLSCTVAVSFRSTPAFLRVARVPTQLQTGIRSTNTTNCNATIPTPDHKCWFYQELVPTRSPETNTTSCSGVSASGLPSSGLRPRWLRVRIIHMQYIEPQLFFLIFETIVTDFKVVPLQKRYLQLFIFFLAAKSSVAVCEAATGTLPPHHRPPRPLASISRAIRIPSPISDCTVGTAHC